MNMAEKTYFTPITWKLEIDGFSTPALFTPDVRSTRRTSRVAQGCQPSLRNEGGHPGRCTDVTGKKARPRLKVTSVICKGTRDRRYTF